MKVEVHEERASASVLHTHTYMHAAQFEIHSETPFPLTEDPPVITVVGNAPVTTVGNPLQI